MESVLIIRITYLDTDRILIPGVNGVLETLKLLQSACKGFILTFSQSGKKKSFERKFAEINISTAHSSKNHRDIKLHFWSFAFNETIYIPYFILFPSSCRCWKKFTAMSKEYLLSVHCCSCHQHSHHTDSRLPGGTRRTVKWHDMYEGDACKQT